MQIACTLFAHKPTHVSVCLQTVGSICAYINHEQVRMDYCLFTPPGQFFGGTCVKFDTTLKDCWYGCLVLLFRVRVKLDKKRM